MGAIHDLRMPKLGLTMTEGTLVEWKAKPGQPVRRGDVLFVVETEKVANEIEASADGSIGETVDIGVAVETERGLLAPLLRDVGRAPLDSIAAAATRLVDRAKSGGLTIKDVQGGR